MTRLIVERIELLNDGPLLGEHHFTLADGACAWVAPNESGKSTLLNAIGDILYGSTGRTRSWTAPTDAPHRGTLHIRRDTASSAQRFRVTRDFRTQAVSATELLANGTTLAIFDGTHKPRGRTADQARWSDELLPVVWAPLSPEAFRAVAMCARGSSAPDAAALQSLLGGRGRATAEDAEKRLSEEFKKLSRFSKSAGLTSQDGRSDGALELAKAALAQLRTERMTAEQALAAHLQARESLAAAERQCAAAQADAQSGGADADVLRRARTARDEHRRFADRAAQLEAAQEEIRRGRAELADADAALAQLPDVLRNADAAHLEALRAAAVETERRRTELRELRSARASREAELQRLADVADWPDDGMQLAEQALLARPALIARTPGLSARRPTTRRIAWIAASALLVGAIAAAALGSWLWSIALVVLFACAIGIALTARRSATHAAPSEQPAIESPPAPTWLHARSAAEIGALIERRRHFESARQALAEHDTRIADAEAALRAIALPDALRNRPDAQALIQQAAGRHAARRTATEKLDAVLRTSGVRSAEAIDAELTTATDRRAAAQQELDALVRSSALAEEALRDASRFDELARQAQSREQSASGRLASAQSRQQAAQRELHRLDATPLPNIAALDADIARTESSAQQIAQRCEAIRLARRLLDTAQESLRAHDRESIEQTINQHWRAWTARADRVVSVDADWSIAVRRADAADAAEIAFEALSSGALDQLALAARLAVLDRLGDGVALPLLIDDALGSWDDERFAAGSAALRDASAERQVILVSHEERCAAFGEPIRHEIRGVVRTPPPADQSAIVRDTSASRR